jgi:prephenate dehydratase
MQVSKNVGITIYGIQGGKGSFNEMAIKGYLDNKQIAPDTAEIKYLYTTKGVLNALKNKEIDFGQFAIYNTLGGIVKETIDAISNGKYYFKIVEKYQFIIEHHLMKQKDVRMSEITQIMTHPQVFAQCRTNLKRRYPQLKHVVGKGDLIDNAKAAEAVATTNLGLNTAYLGNKVLSEIYNLEIIEEGLQDAKENLTSFLLVKRH